MQVGQPMGALTAPGVASNEVQAGDATLPQESLDLCIGLGYGLSQFAVVRTRKGLHTMLLYKQACSLESVLFHATNEGSEGQLRR